MKKIALITTVLLLCLSAASTAQQKTAPPVTLSISVTDADITDTLKKIGEKADAKVLADSTVSGKITLNIERKTLDQALTETCEKSKLAWKVVYLAKGTVPAADNVSQLVRTLDALEATGMVILDRPASKATAMVKDTRVGPDYEAKLSGKDSNYSPVYLVYNPKLRLGIKDREQGKVSWKTGDPMDSEQFAEVSKESMEQLMNMSPEQQRAAIESSMKIQMEMMQNNPQIFQMFMREGMRMQMDVMAKNPEYFTQMVQMGMEAQMEMFKNMTPEMMRTIGEAQKKLMESIPPEQLQRMIEIMKPQQ